MSDKKYYVKLRPEVMYYSDYGFGSIQYLEPYLNDSGYFAPATDRASFTKSELGKIMNGALYIADTSAHLMGENTDFLSDIEWINPLIKLVPVEDGE